MGSNLIRRSLILISNHFHKPPSYRIRPFSFRFSPNFPSNGNQEDGDPIFEQLNNENPGKSWKNLKSRFSKAVPKQSFTDETRKYLASLRYNPTSIHKQVWAAALHKCDLKCISPRDYHRHLSFVIPAIDVVNSVGRDLNHVKVCVIALNADHVNEIGQIFSRTGFLRILELFSKQSLPEEIESVDIIVATPDHLITAQARWPHLLNEVRLVIVDECNLILETRLKKSLIDVLGSLDEQNFRFIFASQWNHQHQRIMKNFLREPTEVRKINADLKQIRHKALIVESDQDGVDMKLEALIDLVHNERRHIIVFTKASSTAKILSEHFKTRGFETAFIPSSSKIKRDQIVNAIFRKNPKMIFVDSQNLMNIEFNNVSLIINYDSPGSEQEYLSRLLKISDDGEILTFVFQNEQKHLNAIAKSISVNLKFQRVMSAKFKPLDDNHEMIYPEK